MNVSRKLRIWLGWCPNTNAHTTKRVLLALPVNEDSARGNKGKAFKKYGEMGERENKRTAYIAVKNS